MLDHALIRNFIEQNPARTLRPKDFAATAGRPRDRVLSLDELTHLWLALNKAPNTSLSPVIKTAIKLLILTGARRGEVVGMRWEELNFERRIWTLPAERTKNRQSHVIHLSDLSIQLIQSLEPTMKPFVFYSPRSSNDYIHPDSLTGAIAKLRGAATGKKKAKEPDCFLAEIPPFSVHDLRRSAATAWGEHLKTAPHVIERMLNHQPINKLIAVYQRAIYADEQKAAWLKWGEVISHKLLGQMNETVD